MIAIANWMCECGWALKRVLLTRPKNEDDRLQWALVCQNQRCPHFGKRHQEPALNRVVLQELPPHEARA